MKNNKLFRVNMLYKGLFSLLLLWIYIFNPATLVAQEIKVIDLAEVDAGTVHSRPVKAGKVKFQLKHVIPNDKFAYQVKIEREIFVPEVFDFSKVLPVDSIEERVRNKCDLVVLADSLKSQKSEKKVKEYLYKVEKVFGCEPNKLAFLKTTVVEIIPDTIEIKKGEQVTVTIIRTEAASADSLTWTIEYKSDPPGKWVVNYGFTFVPNILWFKNDNYFAQANEGGEGYTITEGTGDRGLEYIPSIFFTWMPNNHKKITTSFSGGLGFDMEDPTAMLAVSFTYRYNLSLHMGVIALKRDRLKGRYLEGQEVIENLSHDQLHDSVYKPGFFISLAFRFGDNPFTNANKE